MERGRAGAIIISVFFGAGLVAMILVFICVKWWYSDPASKEAPEQRLKVNLKVNKRFGGTKSSLPVYIVCLY